MRLGALLSHYRKQVGAVAALVYVQTVSPTWLDAAMSAAWVGSALALRLWAAGYPSPTDQVVTVGPYSIVRHPTEFGTMLAVVGLALLTGNVWIGLLSAPLYAWITLPQLERQERRVELAFGHTAIAYYRRVPRFVPLFNRYEPAEIPWRVSLALTERHEWRAWIVIAILWAFGFAHSV